MSRTDEAECQMLKVLAVAGAAAGLTACSDYLDRRDSLYLGAGEAVQTNIVTHRIDPWPVHAQRVYAETSGERMQRAVEAYRAAPPAAPASVATPGSPAPKP